MVVVVVVVVFLVVAAGTAEHDPENPNNSKADGAPVHADLRKAVFGPGGRCEKPG